MSRIKCPKCKSDHVVAPRPVKDKKNPDLKCKDCGHTWKHR
jgi:predicted Zn finger-like uncharacterized protein